MPHSLLCQLLLCLLLASPVMAEESAFDAASRGDFKTAHQLWSHQAEKGDATAQYNLAFLYSSGQGVAQNFEKAAYWYEKSAKQGEAEAQFYLGRLYLRGEGVSLNASKGVYWYQMASDQGYEPATEALGKILLEGGEPDVQKGVALLTKAAGAGLATAQAMLGDIYASGERGIPQQWDKAVLWYRKAAEQGVPEAYYNLGLAYMEGNGVEQEGESSREWFEKAAGKGVAAAMFNLGVLFEKGELIDQDMATAIDWYEKAASLNLPNAEVALGSIYYEGKGGVAVDHDRAYTFFKKAAARGYEPALHNVEVMQTKGESTGGEGQKWWAQPAAWALAHKEVAVVYLLLLISAPFILFRR